MGELLALCYIGGIAEVALISGISHVLFPELAALSYDIFKRPQGKWASAPILLVLTPFLAAVVGLWLQHQWGYGPLSLGLGISAALFFIKVLRSPIAPAISAGVLPIALDDGSWWYAGAVLFSTSLLALGSVLRQRFQKNAHPPLPPPSQADRIDDEVECPATQYHWLPYFIVFLAIAMGLVLFSGWRFILYPPLVVIAYEMFAHADVCPWARKPVLLVLACLLTASSGLGIFLLLGHGPLAVILSMGVSIALIRFFDLHAPPATAVGLLPFVIDHPDWRFPLAVALGTGLLSLIFRQYKLRHRSLTHPPAQR
ncbi:MAG: HPP family protein [Ferrovum myxofaciens]|uniref:HPP family protein n=1 Tax=Ferrovum myxofaciens TaxID=416213 RepID=UPI002356B772|nr:HPP family protein [Ferrovum myxofaciens]QKE40821.1 MAG: HPP family protein [Ferrovum myxofaciens]